MGMCVRSMPTGVTDRGVAYFECAVCGKVETADDEKQAKYAEALHMTAHRDNGDVLWAMR